MGALFGFFVVLGILGTALGGGSSTPSTPAAGDVAGVSETAAEPQTKTETTAPVAAPVETKKEDSVPVEYKSALAKATSYANNMNMSKKGLYDQLVSDYGEKFSPEAAQYAIDNVKADWNANALAKAKDYQNNMNMSPAAIRDQLTSNYGEKFTAAEADYAIQNLNK